MATPDPDALPSRAPGSVPDPPKPGPVRRLIWIPTGFLSVGVGMVGIVVPGLPSTVFFIIAAWCFARSSPRFERWVLDLPHVGPLVRDYRAGFGMPRRAKAMAVCMIITFASMSVWVNRSRPIIAAVIAVVGVAGITYILLRVPTREAIVQPLSRRQSR